MTKETLKKKLKLVENIAEDIEICEADVRYVKNQLRKIARKLQKEIDKK